MFSTHSDYCTPFVHIFDIIFLFSAELEEPKIGKLGKGLTLYHPVKIFNWSLKKKALKNTAGKEENAGSQHFLLFPQCFLLYQRGKIAIFSNVYFVICKGFQFGEV